MVRPTLIVSSCRVAGKVVLVFVRLAVSVCFCVLVCFVCHIWKMRGEMCFSKMRFQKCVFRKCVFRKRVFSFLGFSRFLGGGAGGGGGENA